MFGTLEVLPARCGGCGDLCGGRAGGGRGETPFGLPAAASLSRCIAAISMDCERGPSSTFIEGSERGSSCALLVEPQFRASMDRLSSIGVKMLCDFACAGKGFG